MLHPELNRILAAVPIPEKIPAHFFGALRFRGEDARTLRENYKKDLKFR